MILHFSLLTVILAFSYNQVLKNSQTPEPSHRLKTGDYFFVDVLYNVNRGYQFYQLPTESSL